jgi:hypothetical protein
MDNFFKGCPAKMSDGRLFTDYRTATRREEYVKYINDIVRDDDYRMFLQKNTDKITENEWEYLKKNKRCFVNNCVHNYPTRVVPPMFVEERNNYNQAAMKKATFKCQNLEDYRLHK